MGLISMMIWLLLLLCLGYCLPDADSQGFIAHIGGTITLPCDGPAATDTKQVMWISGGRPVFWFKNGSWRGSGRYVNRTQLGSIEQNNFSLVINPVRIKDAGVYTCRINGEDIQSIRLIVDDPVCREREDPLGSETKDKQDSDENPPGASSGGNWVVIVGIVVTAGAAVGAAVLIKRQRKRQTDENHPGPSEHLLI